ncbi:MAG: hypothetical protein P8X68_10655 [Desulfobacterales bacterium]|jgi:hypothetical protein
MQKKSGCEDFVHPVLNEEVRTISGHYILSQEKRLSYNGREVLYYLGCAMVDTSCCGPGGCTYAMVPGYIEQWKYRMNSDDRWVTQVTPLRDKVEQQKLRRLIKEKEPVQQVNFGD